MTEQDFEESQEAEAPARPTPADPLVLAAIDQWRKELIDLTRRNRLLKYPASETSSLSLVGPDADLLLADVTGPNPTRWTIWAPPDSDEDDDFDPMSFRGLPPKHLLTSQATLSKMNAALRNLERRGRDEFTDKGLRVLYLAFGTLHWQNEQGDDFRSPLILVPVDVGREGPGAPFTVTRVDDDAVLNPALQVVLQREYGIALPEIEADDELDFTAYLAQLRSTLVPLSTHRIDPGVDLSFFSFMKEAMHRDLLDNEDAIASHPMIAAVARGPQADIDLGFDPVPEDKLDTVSPPEKTFTVLDSDATQRQCVEAARAGHSFVMDGPPGTGKSQTITNVIAELLGSGKTVLFVSEKMAALEVVYKRLTDSGLNHFVLELHSHKATRKEVASRLGQALAEQPRARGAMTSAQLADIEKRRAELNDYATAHNEVRQPLGLSVHEAIGIAGQRPKLVATPPAHGIDATLSADELANIRSLAGRLADSWAPVSNPDAFLWDAVEDAEDAASQIATIEFALDEAIAALTDLESIGIEIEQTLALQAPRDLASAAHLAAVLDHLADRSPVPVAWLCASDLAAQRAFLADAASTSAELNRAEGALVGMVGPAWGTITADEAARISAAVNRFDSLRDSADPVLLAMVPRVGEVGRLIAECATEIATGLATIGEAMAWSPRDRSTATAAAAAELARLIDTDATPDPSWFDGMAAAQAAEAAAVLQPIADEYRSLRAELEQIFEPTVLEIDIDSMFDNGKPALSRFSSTGRTNRAQLRPHTKRGKVTKVVIAHLAQARSWRRTAKQLAATEHVRAGAIGVQYHGPDTDFERLTNAIAVAQRALDIVGAGADRRRLAAVLARGEGARAVLLDAAAVITDRLDALAAHRAEISADGMATESSDLSALSAWGTAVRESSTDLFTSAAPLFTLGAADTTVLATAARDLVSIDEGTTWFADHDEAGRTLLEHFYAGRETVTPQVEERLEWAATLVELLGGPANSEFAASLLLEQRIDPAQLRGSIAVAESRIADALTPFTEKARGAMTAEIAASIEDGIALLEELRGTTAQIDVWATFVTTKRDLSACGLEDVIANLVRNATSAQDVSPVVEREVLRAWIDAIGKTDRRLRMRSSSKDRDRAVDEHRDLDRKVAAHSIARIVKNCADRRPTTTVGEPGVIQREAQKQRKHKPVRDLLAEAGATAQALLPCFMMSPLSVSTFLPAGLHFDVVIFDEASQVRPCDAANAIYRGSQLIIAGDQHQLPPTAFFATGGAEEDDDDETDVGDFKSVLDLVKASARVRSLPLRWHYRSQHESLITYSNVAIYTPKAHPLITFPGALSTDPRYGVELLYVADGVYERGGARDNPEEAATVVERVLHWMRTSPDTSLGVVALSSQQAGRIQDELERAAENDRALYDFMKKQGMDAFFVKNLENVQGDERDVIILSVGYGRSAEGRLTMNFGPINKQEGYRRLNVAITRARQRVEVVSSIRAQDFELNPTNENVRHLKRYLDYAERGMAALSANATASLGEPESPFEESVIGAIRNWGYDVVPQVGEAGYRIDMAIRNPDRPGRYVLGIECDGVAYHSSATARDRDRLRQDVLEKLGWRLHRIWGTSWYRHRADEERRLREAIDAALRHDPAPRSAVAAGPVADVTVTAKELTDRPEWATPYVVTRVRASAKRAELTATNPEVERVITHIVEAEGPIHEDLLAERVRDAFFLARLGGKVRAQYELALNACVRRNTIERVESNFFDRPGRTATTIRSALDAEGTQVRKVGQVSLIEIELAIMAVVDEARRIQVPELVHTVRAGFGWFRTGADIEARIRAAVQGLISAEELASDGDFVGASERNN